MDFKLLCDNLNAHFQAQLLDKNRKDVRLYCAPPCEEFFTFFDDNHFANVWKQCNTCVKFIRKYGFLVFKNEDSCESPLWSLPLEQIPLDFQLFFIRMNHYVVDYAQYWFDALRVISFPIHKSILGVPQSGEYSHLSVTFPGQWFHRCYRLNQIHRFWGYLCTQNSLTLLFKRRKFGICFALQCGTCFKEEQCTHIERTIFPGEHYNLIDMSKVTKLEDLFIDVDRNKWNMHGVTDKVHTIIMHENLDLFKTYSKKCLLLFRNEVTDRNYCESITCARYAMPSYKLCFICANVKK